MFKLDALNCTDVDLKNTENTAVQLHSRHPTPGNPPNPWARRSDESWVSCGTVSAGVTGI